MAGKKADFVRPADARAQQVFAAADQIRAEGKERVSLRTVWARVKRNVGVAGSNQLVGEHLAAWAKDRKYSPIIELAGMPEAVSTQLAKAGVDIWEAAHGRRPDRGGEPTNGAGLGFGLLRRRAGRPDCEAR